MQLAKDLAKCILATAELHENSFDHKAAEATTSVMEDVRKHYRITLHDAAKQSCPEELVQPVYLLLQCSWNDALDWARATAV